MNSFIKKHKIKFALITGLALIGFLLFVFSKNGQEAEEEKVFPKSVETVNIEKGTYNQNRIKSVASVEADSQVNAVALNSGTVKLVSFGIGDTVRAGQVLAVLHNDNTLIALNNARTGLINAEGAYLSVGRITEETVKQAELGVKNAEEALASARIGLNSAQDNLENSVNIRTKSNQDARNTAVTSYRSYLNAVFEVIDYSNNIISVEGHDQLPGISKILGVKDLSTINRAQSSYYRMDKAYEELESRNISENNIESAMSEVVSLLEEAKGHIDNMIELLENSISGGSFSEADLLGQKNIFYGLRSNFVSTIVAAKNLKQNLGNLDLLYESEIEGLENAVKAAQSRLESAEIGLKNARISLESARQSANQQLINSQAAVDNTRGQLNLAQNQAGELYIKAPISGRITKKTVETGSEVNIGQSIAEISQDDFLKIKFSVSGQDVYRISIGQTVNLDNGREAFITKIAPAADPATRQIAVEAAYDNSGKDLIQGTFVDISIPTKALELSSPNSLLVPIKAVSLNQNESYVFTAVREGIEAQKEAYAKKVNVKTGLIEGALIEITEGLSEGDELVVEGAKNLKDKDLIKIIK